MTLDELKKTKKSQDRKDYFLAIMPSKYCIFCKDVEMVFNYKFGRQQCPSCLCVKSFSWISADVVYSKGIQS
jgi:predicted Zn-ribbon and HTH transcriptional regulator